MIKTGTADLIIGFEPGETVRMLPYLKEHGQVVVSTHAIKPVTATLSGSSYDAPPMIDYLKKHVENRFLTFHGSFDCVERSPVRTAGTKNRRTYRQSRRLWKFLCF